MVADLAGLYRVAAMRPQARGFARILQAATGELVAAVDLLPADRDYSGRTAAVGRLRREAAELARGAIGELCAGESEPLEVIRWKDLFERLERAVDACRRAAPSLDVIALKRG